MQHNEDDSLKSYVTRHSPRDCTWHQSIPLHTVVECLFYTPKYFALFNCIS